ncbi:shikimate kinase [Bacteroides sp. OttesenSCG-928-D19]|nr:shikimate kinase [Bacteroides sp. OttesenSCG-928-N06]MDL2305858.1 shikimate kinase [Bacteroides sp. OttesenSCG-928-D19]
MQRFFLIGYMGAGKTTLGKAFAKRMNLSFVDLDWYIEERFRKTVSELFAQKGEEGFRQLEKKMLHEVSEFENIVISTGGGTPCFFDNMEYMNNRGTTIFLDVSTEVLFRRLTISRQSRPIVRDKSDEELKLFIQQSLHNRLPSYLQARYTFNAELLANRSQVETSVNHLLALLHIEKQ